MTKDTDRELLEKAAKAAGWTWWRSKHGYWNITPPKGETETCCVNWQKFDSTTGEKLPEPTLFDALIESGWNPIDDDGDALRLAVKLHMSIMSNETASWVATGMHQINRAEEHHDGSDPYAATRCAIVCAAAAIGEAMP